MAATLTADGALARAAARAARALHRAHALHRAPAGGAGAGDDEPEAGAYSGVVEVEVAWPSGAYLYARYEGGRLARRDAVPAGAAGAFGEPRATLHAVPLRGDLGGGGLGGGGLRLGGAAGGAGAGGSDYLLPALPPAHPAREACGAFLDECRRAGVPCAVFA